MAAQFFMVLYKVIQAEKKMKIIYPEVLYAPELPGLPSLYDRREAIAPKLFDEIKNYVQINLTVFTNYFQVNTNQATI